MIRDREDDFPVGVGKARLVAFRRDPLPECTPTWKLFVSPGKGDGR